MRLQASQAAQESEIADKAFEERIRELVAGQPTLERIAGAMLSADGDAEARTALFARRGRRIVKRFLE